MSQAPIGARRAPVSLGWTFGVLASAALGLGCGGAGPYGHALHYVPLSEETAATKVAKEYDPVMVQRLPDEWKGKPVSLFGVVVSRDAVPRGSASDAYVTLSVRRLESRNLCESAYDERTCRVTVTDSDFGKVHAIVALKADDAAGEHSVGSGSLLRLVGTFQEQNDSETNAPVVRATYYRHWPRNYFVTKASAEHMRQ